MRRSSVPRDWSMGPSCSYTHVGLDTHRRIDHAENLHVAQKLMDEDFSEMR